MKTVHGQSCADGVFPSTAFASLSSRGIVSGMKFVLAPSHPSSSSPLKNQEKSSPQKRTLEQGKFFVVQSGMIYVLVYKLFLFQEL